MAVAHQPSAEEAYGRKTTNPKCMCPSPMRTGGRVTVLLSAAPLSKLRTASTRGMMPLNGSTLRAGATCEEATGECGRAQSDLSGQPPLRCELAAREPAYQQKRTKMEVLVSALGQEERKQTDPGWKRSYTVCIQRKPSHLCRKSNGVYKKVTRTNPSVGPSHRVQDQHILVSCLSLSWRQTAAS